jgi:hypothetical protein
MLRGAQVSVAQGSVRGEFWCVKAGALLPHSIAWRPEGRRYGGQPSLVLPISATRRS